jgi:hypothetical protein
VLADADLIRFAGVSDITIQRCRFIKWRNVAINIWSGEGPTAARHNSQITIKDNFFDGVVANNSSGVFFNDINGIEIKNNYFTNISRYGDRSGGYVSPNPFDRTDPTKGPRGNGVNSYLAAAIGSCAVRNWATTPAHTILKNINISNNYIANTQEIGIMVIMTPYYTLQDTVPHVPENIFVTDNVINGSTNSGLNVSNFGPTGVIPRTYRTGVTISGNIVRNSLDYGLNFSSISGAIIRGNTFTDVAYGVRLGGTDTIFDSNFITRGGYSGTRNYCLEVKLFPDNLTISRNVFDTCGFDLQTTGIGIKMMKTNTNEPFTNVKIIDNLFTGTRMGAAVASDAGIAFSGGRHGRNILLTALTWDFAGATDASLGASYQSVDSPTPSVAQSTSTYVSYSGTVTDFTNGYSGQTITLNFAGTTTVAHNANIKLSGAVNWTPSVNATLTLLKTGTVWREISRSTN